MTHDEWSIFAGSAHPGLAAAIARELGATLSASAVARFPDGELLVELQDSVRGHEVFVVQPTSPPVNDHLVELLAFSDACRRAAAARVTAIVPYFGYARADKRQGRRVPITASMVADLMQSVGIQQVVTLDLHTAQIEGFFSIPVESLSARRALTEAVQPHLNPETVVVSPDTGRVPMATEYAHTLGLPVVVLHKRRESGSETVVTHVVGDVSGKACLIVDDMIATGGTLIRSIEALLAAGARPDLLIAVTHGLFVAPAREALLRYPSVRAIFVADTMPVETSGWQDRLHVVTVAPLLAEVIRRLRADGSLTMLG
jgi:ribose-phosphate pyrophosphokinase